MIADCTGDNAGDSVGPSADGFETYGVTGVALISFILLAVTEPATQVQLLVWIFVMRIMMVIASGVSYLINEAIAKAKYAERRRDELRSAAHVPRVAHVDRLGDPHVHRVVPPDPGSRRRHAVVEALDGHHLRNARRRDHSGAREGLHVDRIAHVKEVVTSSREGGPSLNILSGLVAGNFSAYWLGITIMVLMSIAYGVSTLGLSALMIAPAVFAFGLVAFGFLGMGPVTIAVDSYGPVTDNAQSVFELSTIEQLPGIAQEIQSDYGFTPKFERAKHLLEENDGAGNTFKATAKPVLIGTAVVGATTMIFSIIVSLTHGLQPDLVVNLSLLHPPFLLGLITGGAIIYWFTGASTQAVTTGAYRAVEFIKANMNLESAAAASVEDSQEGRRDLHEVRAEGNVQHLPHGVLLDARVRVRRAVLLHRLPDLDRAVRSVPGDLHGERRRRVGQREEDRRGRAQAEGNADLHAATVVGDTVGDPFKDTSSVALNPIIKFTTLFGLLAVELAVSLTEQRGPMLVTCSPLRSSLVSMFFVYRSFYGMRIEQKA